MVQKETQNITHKKQNKKLSSENKKSILSQIEDIFSANNLEKVSSLNDKLDKKTKLAFQILNLTLQDILIPSDKHIQQLAQSQNPNVIKLYKKSYEQRRLDNIAMIKKTYTKINEENIKKIDEDYLNLKETIHKDIKVEKQQMKIKQQQKNKKKQKNNNQSKKNLGKQNIQK